jgi:hypothetical protein
MGGHHLSGRTTQVPTEVPTLAIATEDPTEMAAAGMPEMDVIRQLPGVEPPEDEVPGAGADQEVAAAHSPVVLSASCPFKMHSVHC